MVGPSSQAAAPTRQAAGPKNATACADLRTRATGHPAAISASAEGPATADAAMAAIGGSSDTCPAHGSANRISRLLTDNVRVKHGLHTKQSVLV